MLFHLSHHKAAFAKSRSTGGIEQACRARHVSIVCRCSGAVCRFRYCSIAQLDHIPNTEKKGREQRSCLAFYTRPDTRMYTERKNGGKATSSRKDPCRNT